MTKERLKEIDEYLETILAIHKGVEHKKEFTSTEKMVKELYDSYIRLKDKIDYATDFLESRVKTLEEILETPKVGFTNYALARIECDCYKDALRWLRDE